MMMLPFLLVSFLLITSVSSQYVTIQTDKGAVRGYTNQNVQTFRGIPFASPPTGDLRLHAPQPHPSWGNATIDATQQKPICPQFRVTDWLYLGQEDCLYLDIYTPANRDPSDLLPVIVWIFGGAYTVGDGYEFGFYDGTNLVSKHDYVFVTPNYRVGALGFLALDELRDEDGDASTGNYALQDQTLALQWVQKNIAAFGGDPNRVTIMGESAGAFSVCWHLVNERSAGLFHAAIMESGTCDSPQFFRPYKQSIGWGRDYVTALGCDTSNSTNLLQCIRKLPAGTILGSGLGQQSLFNSSYVPALYPAMPWGPTIDGSVAGLKDVPLNLMKKGKWNKVNVIMGTNHNEGSIFVPTLAVVVPGTTFPLIASQLPHTIEHFFHHNITIVNQILEQYPLSAYKTVNDLTSELLRDYFFVCAARRTLKILSQQQVKTWLYHFTYIGDFIEDPYLGVYHGADLDFVMDNPWPPLLHTFSARDQAMSDIMTQFWSNFVHTYNPNGNGREPKPMTWPEYDITNLINLVFDDPPTAQTDLLEKRCQFWDQIVSEPW